MLALSNLTSLAVGTLFVDARVETFTAEAYTITVLALALVAALLRIAYKECPKKNRASISENLLQVSPLERSKADAEAGIPEFTAGPDGARLEGTFTPSTGVVYSNTSEAFPFENNLGKGSFLALHRPTHDPALNKSGNYAYGHVFNGTNNLWELRMQVKFKVAPTGPLVFGIVLDEYVPMGASQKYAVECVVKALQWVVGKDLYHSVGDDPMRTQGELEKPVFGMPLWALDQLIETPEGQQPPSVTDPNLHSMGASRAAYGHKKFAKHISELKLTVGPTYTLCFWSISKLMDLICWEICGVLPGVRIGFNNFCGRAPVHAMLYTLEPAEGGSTETRHLESRKNTYFHLATWSSRHRPSQERLQELYGSKKPIRLDRCKPEDSGTVSDESRSKVACLPTLRCKASIDNALRKGSKTNRKQPSCLDGIFKSASS